jgi:ElaB/YqjD/DUF883 family membrane-anchored ribosome-binding protein
MTNRDRLDEDMARVETETEETRGRIGEDLQALGEKLTPAHLKEEVKAEAKQMIGEAKEAAAEKIHEAKESVKESVSTAGRATAGFVRRNAVPLALIGAGLGWFFVSRRTSTGMGWGARRRPGRRMAGVQDRAEYLLHEGSEKAKEMGRSVQRRLQGASVRTRSFAEESPLAVGALAVAAGVGVGLLVPSTQQENRLLGGKRDRLIGEAKDTAGQIGETVKETARELKQAVQAPLAR